jgi:alpha-L-arabinofuranosidase
MKFTRILILSLSITLFTLFAQGKQNRIIVNVGPGKVKINKYIYGHFSEHLGHCIYGGIWVGENSPIPNTRGINPDKDSEIEIDLRGAVKLSEVKGEIITALKMNDYNDFGKPEKVNLKSFSGYKSNNNIVVVKLPTKSVFTFEIE